LETHESGHCIDHEVVICDQRTDFLRVSQIPVHGFDVVVSSRQGVQYLLVLVDDGDFELLFFCQIDSHRATDQAATKYDHFHDFSPCSRGAIFCAAFFLNFEKQGDQRPLKRLRKEMRATAGWRHFDPA
jgi:hypothetical protein